MTHGGILLCWSKMTNKCQHNQTEVDSKWCVLSRSVQKHSVGQGGLWAMFSRMVWEFCISRHFCPVERSNCSETEVVMEKHPSNATNVTLIASYELLTTKNTNGFRTWTCILRRAQSFFTRMRQVTNFMLNLLIVWHIVLNLFLCSVAALWCNSSNPSQECRLPRLPRCM